MGRNPIGQKRLEEILQHIDEGIIYQEAGGKIRLFNQAAQRIFDLTAEEATGRTSMHPEWHLVYEDGSPCPGPEHPSMITLRTGQALSGQIRGIAGPDRPVTWISISTRPIFSPGQDLPEAVVISFSDVTDRKRAEQRQREGEARFKSIFENSLDAILLTVPDGSIIAANPAACRMFGLTEVEFRRLGRNGLVDTSDSRLPAALEELRRAGSFRGELTFIRKDGSKFPGEIGAVVFKEQQGRDRTSMVIRDITDRKQAEEALKKSEKRLRAILDLTPFPIAIVDEHDDKIHYWSNNAKAIFGHTAPTASEWYKIAYPDLDYRRDVIERWKPCVEKARSSGKIVKAGEYKVTCRDGSERICELYAAFHENNLIVTFNNITERKQVEKDLKESQKIARLGSWRLNVQTNEVYWTEELYRMYGFDPKLPPPPYTEHMKLFTPESWHLLFASLAKTVETGVPYELELEMLKPDGSNGWMWVRGEAICDESGKTVELWGAAQDITDRKQAENLLRSSEERYKLMFDNAPVGYQSLDSNGYILDVNQAWLNMLGYQRDEVMGQWFGNFLHEDQKAVFRELFPINIQSTEPILGVEFTLKRKDGSYLFAEYAARIGRDGVGNFVRTHCVFQDITERKEKEHELRHRREFESLISQISSDFVGLTKNKTDKGINEALALIGSFVGADRAYVFTFKEDGERIRNTHEWCNDAVEPQKDNLQDICLDEELPWFAQRIRAREVFCVSGIADLPPEAALEREHFQSQSIQSLIVLPISQGDRLIGFLGFDSVTEQRIWNEDDRSLLKFASYIIGQVLERRSVEEALRASEQSYRELFNSIKDLVYTQDLQGRFLSLNPSLASILGYEPEELMGTKASQLMEPKFRELFETEYLGKLKRVGNHQGTTKYLAKNGEAKYLEYNSSLVTNEEGKQYITGIGRDVTERIKAQKQMEGLQKQLLQTQKMEAVGTLAGGIAHNFNNILSIIVGNAEFALEEGAHGRTNLREIENVLEASDRAKSLVRQILSFSRGDQAQLKLMDLNKVVVPAINLLQQTLPKMIELRIELKDNISPVKVDPYDIEQLIINLGTNSRDAMPDGGKLTVSTSQSTVEDMTCQACTETFSGEFVVITVADTGQGMSEEELEKIFDPFYTTKEVGKGTGLGLSTVFGIVNSHNGHITCTSESGKGTTFRIFLPTSDAEPEALDAEVPDEKIKGGQETILLVDDEQPILEVVTQQLSGLGYHVMTAHSGEEALEVFKAKRGEISLIILDLSMPGMGGHKCLQELLSLESKIKVIVSTGYSLDGDLGEVLSSGAVALLSKPFSKNEMLKTVRMVLDAE